MLRVAETFIIFIFFLHVPLVLYAHIHTCFQFCDREEIVSRTEKELLRSELNRCIEKVQKAHAMKDTLTTHFYSHLTFHFLLYLTNFLVFFQVMSLDSSLQTLTQQNARLKSDLRITQQERDALKQEVISLHKQVQYANEKVSIEDRSLCNLN